MEKEFFDNIDKYEMITEGDNIVVALSGGADSIALITLLSKYIKYKKLKVNIIAVHINHNLREESFEDELFCKNYTKNLKIEFYTKSVDLYKYKKEHKVTIEEAGRILRYEAFREVFQNQKIFLGHNKDDNIETLILNLVRGSGTKGLVGMDFVQNDIYRPLLSFTKSKIYEYLNKNLIDFVEDKSNKENIYSRNIIRNEISPLLYQLNNNFIENISRAQLILKEENDFLTQITITKLNECKLSKTSINLEKFNDFDTVIKKRVVLKILEDNFSLKDINTKHIYSILSICESKNGTKTINLPKKIFAKKYNNILSFGEVEKVTHKDDFYYKLEFNKFHFIKEINKYIYITNERNIEENYDFKKNKNNLNLTIVKNKFFLYNRYNVIIRSRLCGDKIFLSQINGHKKIKKYFIDKKVPIEQRSKIPLLTIENTNEVLWILDNENYTNHKYTTKDNLSKINILIMEEKQWQNSSMY